MLRLGHKEEICEVEKDTAKSGVGIVVCLACVTGALSNSTLSSILYEVRLLSLLGWRGDVPFLAPWEPWDTAGITLYI